MSTLAERLAAVRQRYPRVSAAHPATPSSPQQALPCDLSAIVSTSPLAVEAAESCIADATAPAQRCGNSVTETASARVLRLLSNPEEFAADKAFIERCERLVCSSGARDPQRSSPALTLAAALAERREKEMEASRQRLQRLADSVMERRPTPIKLQLDDSAWSSPQRTTSTSAALPSETPSTLMPRRSICSHPEILTASVCVCCPHLLAHAFLFPSVASVSTTLETTVGDVLHSTGRGLAMRLLDALRRDVLSPAAAVMDEFQEPAFVAAALGVAAADAKRTLLMWSSSDRVSVALDRREFAVVLSLESLGNYGNSRGRTKAENAAAIPLCGETPLSALGCMRQWASACWERSLILGAAADQPQNQGTRPAHCLRTYVFALRPGTTDAELLAESLGVSPRLDMSEFVSLPC